MQQTNTRGERGTPPPSDRPEVYVCARVPENLSIALGLAAERSKTTKQALVIESLRANKKIQKEMEGK